MLGLTAIERRPHSITIMMLQESKLTKTTAVFEQGKSTTNKVNLPSIYIELLYNIIIQILVQLGTTQIAPQLHGPIQHPHPTNTTTSMHSRFSSRQGQGGWGPPQHGGQPAMSAGRTPNLRHNLRGWTQHSGTFSPVQSLQTLPSSPLTIIGGACRAR